MRRLLPCLWPLLAAPAVVLAADATPATPTTAAPSTAPTQPDEVDKAAIQELRGLIERRMRDQRTSGAGSLGLSALLDLEIKTGITRFSDREIIASDRPADADANSDGEGCSSGHSAFQLPTRRPDGVSEDEWTALHDSGLKQVHCGAQDYTLIDLDGDGRRDLIIDFEPEGSGGVLIFEDVATFRRQGQQFVAPSTGRNEPGGREDEQGGRGRLFTQVQDSHGDSQYLFVSVRGRTYIAYLRPGDFADRILLIRPFAPFEKGEGELAVDIGYRLAPSEFVVGDATTAPLLRAALTTAVRKALQPPQPAKSEPEAHCPTPVSDIHYGTGNGLQPILTVAIPWNGECPLGEIIAERASDPNSWEALNAAIDIPADQLPGLDAHPNENGELVIDITGLRRHAVTVTATP